MSELAEIEDDLLGQNYDHRCRKCYDLFCVCQIHVAFRGSLFQTAVDSVRPGGYPYESYVWSFCQAVSNVQ